MIELKNVSKRYPGEKRWAVENIDLMLSDTGIVFIFGPSGAGKTTLVSLIGGMDREFEGNIESCGKNLGSLSNKELADYRLENVGFSFQNGYLDDKNTVLEEVSKPLTLFGGNKKTAESRARSELSSFGLEGFEGRKIAELSGGERKRVSLARATVCRAPVLIFDEPTSGLNDSLAQKVFDAIVKLSESSLAIVITHDPSFLSLGRVIEMRDGRIVGDSGTEKKNSPSAPKREPYSKLSRILSFFLVSVKYFFRSIKSLNIACFVMAIAITVAGFSILLMSGVGGGMQHVIGSGMDSLSVLARPSEDENAANARNIYLSPQQVGVAMEVAPEFVLGYGAVYPRGVNDRFTSESGFRIVIGDWKYPRHFGLDLLAEASFAKNRPDFLPFSEDSLELGLNTDEVFLGAPVSILNALSEKCADEIDYDLLSDAGRAGRVSLRVSASVPDASGIKERTLIVRDFFVSEEVEVVHSSPSFAERFFESGLGMECSYDFGALDPVPFTLKKAGVLWVYRENLGAFYRRFATSSAWQGYALAKMDDEPNEEAVPVAVTYRKGAEAKPLDAVEIYISNPESIVSYALSSPVYTYVLSGIYEGFACPFFISAVKEELNAVIDRNSLTEFDISGYAFSPGELPEKVWSSSLADSLLGQGIVFLQPEDSPLVCGVFPDDDTGICLSSSLAEKIYGGSEAALNRPLHILMLDRVESTDKGFANHFMEARLTVTGVIENQRDAIYQDPFFPLALAFAHSELNPQFLTCEAFVLRFRSLEALNDLLPSLKDEYPQYRFTTPTKDMTEALNESLASVGKGLGVFAMASVALACLLLFLNLYLSLKKSEKRIGDLSALGARPSDLRLFFVGQALLIGAVATLESYIGLFMAERIVSDQLATIFSGYSSSVGATPYAAVFSIAASCSLSISLVLCLKLGKVSPLQAFRLRK